MRFYVNKNAQPNGDHEVHRSSCAWLPDAENRKGPPVWAGLFSQRSEIVIVKISDVAEAQSGLVLGRKEAKDSASVHYQYKRLTLRALGEDGYIDTDELEKFSASELLDDALFTTTESVVVRLFSPMYPVLIDESSKGLLVPSQLAVLRVKDCKVILPQYLRLCLSQKTLQERVAKIESGTAQRTVKIGTIMDLEIVVPELKTQYRVVEIDALSRRRERMYRNLIEQERLLTDNIIENIIGGALK